MSLNLTPPSDRHNVAIIGGGRWARVVASILCDISREPSKLVLCSPNRPDGWTEWIGALGAQMKGEHAVLETAETVDDVLANGSIGTVFVVRSAHDHAETAIAALAAGKDTFIEKPFAMTLLDAERVLLAAAKQRCSIGHVLLFAPNLRRFADVVQGLGEPQTIEIQWSDPSGEERSGEAKRYDHSVNITDDVFPHIWSLVKIFVPGYSVELIAVRLEHGGRTAAMRMTAGATLIDAKIERDAQMRQRRISIQTARGGAEIDFSIEPGTAYVLGQPVDIAANYSSPLRRELESFLQISPDSFASGLCNVSKAIEPVVLLEPFRERLDAQRISAIWQGAGPNASFVDLEAALYALREKIADESRRKPSLRRSRGLAHHDEITDKVLRWCRDGDTTLAPPLDLGEFPWLAELKRIP